jgi:thiol-disulfide isomerase/thioredoxin
MVARAVLFYSPTCGHCQTVINEILPPLFEQYRDQLYIIGVDVTKSGGQTLYQAACQHFNMERSGVPMLVVGNVYLVGSLDIPDKFPALIETYLAQGGVDWPDIPGLAEALAAAQPTPSPTAASLLVVATPTLSATTIAASPTSVVPTPSHTAGIMLTGGKTAAWESTSLMTRWAIRWPSSS